MNREEMLKHLGITGPELDEFLKKYAEFLANLDKGQHALISRSLPTMKQAMASFGGQVTAEQLTELFGGDQHTPAMFIGASIGHHKKS
jgi:hypothetical protein